MRLNQVLEVTNMQTNEALGDPATFVPPGLEQVLPVLSATILSAQRVFAICPLNEQETNKVPQRAGNVRSARHGVRMSKHTEGYVMVLT